MSNRDAIRKKRKEVFGSLSNHGAFSRFIELLEQELTDLRSQYEDQPAEEFTRGKIAQQKALIRSLTNRG